MGETEAWRAKRTCLKPPTFSGYQLLPTDSPPTTLPHIYQELCLPRPLCPTHRPSQGAWEGTGLLLFSSWLQACSLLLQVNVSASEFVCGRWLSRTEPRLLMGAAGLEHGSRAYWLWEPHSLAWPPLGVYFQICGLTSTSLSPIFKMGQ